MKVAPAKGNVSPSVKVTSAPIDGSSPVVKVIPPVASNENVGQTSLQPSGRITGLTELEVPGSTNLDMVSPSKPKQINLPEKSSPSVISNTSLQQLVINDSNQPPTPSKSGGFVVNPKKNTTLFCFPDAESLQSEPPGRFADFCGFPLYFTIGESRTKLQNLQINRKPFLQPW